MNQHDDSTQLKRKVLDNALYTAIECLKAVRYQPNATYDDRLKAIHAVEKLLPDIKRALIYFNNIRRGH